MASEDIGDRGQWLFSLLLTDICGRDDPFFRPQFLGDKNPTFDHIVEVVDQQSYFLFVQVKGTTLGYTAEERRLRVQLTQDAGLSHYAGQFGLAGQGGFRGRWKRRPDGLRTGPR